MTVREVSYLRQKAAEFSANRVLTYEVIGAAAVRDHAADVSDAGV